MTEMSLWIIGTVIFAIGLFFWSITYIAAPSESRKKGRNISGFPGIPFLLFLIAGLISPCKWLALLCLLDFSVIALQFFLLREKKEKHK